ncbi:MAG: hypothetical protein ACTHNN_14260 [Xanthobacteraceae bacterium]
MLVVTIDLVPGGYETHRRTIASMEISNVSDLADCSNYRVATREGENPLTGEPLRETACMVLAHKRRQSVFALLQKACAETLKANYVEL